MASEHLKEFTDANFEAEVLQSKQLVLVDFWAQWCPPCVRLAPIVEKLAADYAGRVKVGKLDTDANHNTPMKYGIASIPTVLVFKDGEMIHRIVGLRSEQDFKQALDETLAR